MTAISVHVDMAGGPVGAGSAAVTRTRGIATTRFSYFASYVAGPGWDLSPDLPVTPGGIVSEGLPGALQDSAPDAWGRNLIRRRLARAAAGAGQATPTPTEVDYLLGVSDFTRQGALRFSIDDAQFLGGGTEVPRLIELERLLAAATTVADHAADADEAVAVLLDAGSGSLGGARPKASVVDAGNLFIAKFPHPDDQWDVMRWEAMTYELARSYGLVVPPNRLEIVGSQPVVLVQRFDRRGAERISYLSAQSLAVSGWSADYLELVDAIADHGSDVAADLLELWRRIAFSIVVNNTDDHPRNHGFLRDRGGWKLSPLFDVNPNPNPTAERATSLAGETSADGCQQALFVVADRFGLGADDATRHWNDLLDVVRRWRDLASTFAIQTRERDQFAAVMDRWISPA